MRKEFAVILGALTGILTGVAFVGKLSIKTIKDKQTYADKHLAMFTVMNQWVKIKQEGKSIDEYLREKGIKTIAIYGMSYIGQSFLAELKDSDVLVLYGIDKRADDIYCDIDIYTIEEPLPKVDAVVVTSIYYFEEIEENLRTKMDCPILSLEDIVYDM